MGSQARALRRLITLMPIGFSCLDVANANTGEFFLALSNLLCPFPRPLFFKPTAGGDKPEKVSFSIKLIDA